MTNEKIIKLIDELQKYDNLKGYKLEYDDVKNKLEPIIKEIISAGEEALNFLYPLLENEERWSCLFTLEILKEIKSEKSIPYLISFIEENDEGDYWENCEDAMNALVVIGKPAIPMLMNCVKKNFNDNKDFTFLNGALTGIKDSAVYEFMVEIVRDYIKDYKKYDDWFEIDMFVSDFDKQENLEVLPLLNKLIKMPHLSKEERAEIEDTIRIIKDPKKFKEETEKKFERFKESFESFDKFLNKTEFSEDEKKEFFENASESDENFEANFICHKCKERQNIKTGLIWIIDHGQKSHYSFEREIMCKHCHSHDIELTQDGIGEIFGKQMRILAGKDKGIISIGKKIMIENKKIQLDKAYDYILKRLKEDPKNGELYLRAANTAEKFNKYGEAITFYEKSLELNSNLIASYANLVEIYLNRFDYYEIDDAGKKAIDYFGRLTELFRSQNYNLVTIRSKEYIQDFIIESAKRLGLDVIARKIGRNDPCPCGSGKKYKKCCLDNWRKE